VLLGWYAYVGIAGWVPREAAVLDMCASLRGAGIGVGVLGWYWYVGITGWVIPREAVVLY
jgi:hypothetical protein